MGGVEDDRFPGIDADGADFDQQVVVAQARRRHGRPRQIDEAETWRSDVDKVARVNEVRA